MKIKYIIALLLVASVSMFAQGNSAGKGNAHIDVQKAPAQINADWNATNGPALILNKPTIIAPVNADWNATSGLAMILNKPANVSQVNADWNATSGLAQILNKPTIPAAQVPADWNATSGPAIILNKPVIPVYVPQVQPDWNATSGLGSILNKPSIPLPQVNADWNATSGITQILNKPSTMPTAWKVSSQSTDYTLQPSDIDSVIAFGFAPTVSKLTVTLPLESGAGLGPNGSRIEGFVSAAGGIVFITGQPGVTIISANNAYRTKVKGSVWRLTKISTNVWSLSGDLYSLQQTAYVGDRVTLRATVDELATPPFTFQWYKNDVALSGQTQASLKFETVTTTDSGDYKATVTNINGTTTTEVTTLTVL